MNFSRLLPRTCITATTTSINSRTVVIAIGSLIPIVDQLPLQISKNMLEDQNILNL